MGLFDPTPSGGTEPTPGGGLFTPTLSRPSRSRGPASLPELQAQVAELEALQVATGAPEIEQAKPGVFRGLLDILSRTNFGIAGFVEEIASEQPSVARGVKRALTEIFSGVGGLQGEKRAFGEVLENLGAGTTTLADAFPALEGTWVGNFGSRGAAGLALDIATDPLTYMTLGASAGAKVLLRKGVALSDKGLDAFNAILKSDELAERFGKLSPRAQDPFSLGDTGRLLKRQEVAEDMFTERFTKTGRGLRPEFVDQGGVRLFGRTVIRGETFTEFNRVLKEGIKRLPGGSSSLDAAATFGEGFRRGINQMFHPFNELGNLPQPLRGEAIRLRRNFMNAAGAHRQRIRGILETGNDTAKVAPKLARRYVAEAKSDPKLGEKLYSIREATGEFSLSDLTQPQRQIYDEFVELHDTMGGTLVDAGVFEEGGLIAGRYFHHGYTRESLEALDQYHSNLGTQFTGAIKETITKHRPFRTFREAIDVSEELNRLGRQSVAAGKAARLYPKLVPDYDLLKNFNSYIDQYSDALARKGWHEEAVAKFGSEIDKWDLNVHHITNTGRKLPEPEAQQLENFFGQNAKTFRELTEEASVEVGGLAVGPATTKLLREAERVVAGLSGDGKAEFIGQLLERARSAPQAASIAMHLRGKWGKFFPDITRTLPDGLADSSALEKLFGNSARTVVREGSMWGPKSIRIPQIIARDIERVNSKLLNTKDYESFGKLLRGFDTANNFFKWGVYTLWPASAARDAYSNIALSMLDVGVSALDPKLHADAIAIMAGRNLDRVAAGGFTRKELRRLSRDLGVWVPGEVFIEFTGDAAKSGTLTKGPFGAATRWTARKRALIENEARVQLWLANIRRGIDPRQAADHVATFLFNYGEVSQVEREFFRRLIPFYTFTRKNVELQWKTLRRNPGMQVNQLKPFRGRQDENEQMVEWEAEALKLRMDRNGKSVQMITGIDLPLRNIDTIWRGDFGSTGRGLAGMITPLLKTWPQLLTNHDFFLNRELTRTESGFVGRFIENAGTPKAMKDWLGYKKTVDDAGRSRYTFDGQRFTLAFRSWMLSRAISTGDRQFRDNLGANGDVNWQRGLFDVLTGLRRKDINLDEQGLRRMRERRRQLEESLVRRGVLREFTRTFEPQDAGELQ